MDTLFTLLAVLAGLLIRLAIPIGVTVLLVQALKHLDTRWQAEATSRQVVENPGCWEIKNCPFDVFANCLAARSSRPCWQLFRSPNGHLREDCLTCEVFVNAPIPSSTLEPRRM